MASLEPAFLRIKETARRVGLGVWIENIPTGLLPDAAAIANFAARHQGVGVVYDVANAFSIGEDLIEGRERLARLRS